MAMQARFSFYTGLTSLGNQGVRRTVTLDSKKEVDRYWIFTGYS